MMKIEKIKHVGSSLRERKQMPAVVRPPSVFEGLPLRGSVEVRGPIHTGICCCPCHYTSITTTRRRRRTTVAKCLPLLCGSHLLERAEAHQVVLRFCLLQVGRLTRKLLIQFCLGGFQLASLVHEFEALFTKQQQFRSLRVNACHEQAAILLDLAELFEEDCVFLPQRLFLPVHAFQLHAEFLDLLVVDARHLPIDPHGLQRFCAELFEGLVLRRGRWLLWRGAHVRVQLG
mmetsp:Transcript_9098/g.22275  ORF Transcript_9098/g.22275 Transcript_9098/m.22275 type:complete len:231 (-) Transcript_9098:1627-2319(-)